LAAKSETKTAEQDFLKVLLMRSPIINHHMCLIKI